MRPHTVHAVMAVKHIDRAKSRLAEVLTPQQRGRLVLAMFADTVVAATAVPEVRSLTVVTPDPLVAARARELGAHVLDEPATDHDPLNTALAAGAADVRDRHGPSHLLALQADLPALRAAELTDLLVVAPAGGRSVVIDHTGTGTAALLVRDATAPLTPRFGADSARAHRDGGARELAGHWPGLRCDVDTPADLDIVRALGVGEFTARTLRAFGMSPHRGDPVRTVC
ncbi:2-phospho-L-lactate guanylyltransferase [Nocardia mangyaensis]|uniref:2-phospho-L-lactate guanylyltransferase n=1 Tax=Nocardia mangyaensis TaxID=2213200 RepID=UPI00267499DA|nr:2-phospho-L-lactate guanylyltransferase [Nocardia mangyaensis]MDO3645985.1 2-phospho-L-lactate guanylyltransferase [Nocardia mangyaensis]